MNAITTKLSTKGQLVLPKTLRDKLKWVPGTELIVEDTPGGILIRSAPPAKPATLDQLFGSLADDRSAMTVEDMDDAIAKTVLERDARSRH